MFDAFGGHSAANNIVLQYRKAYDALGATARVEDNLKKFIKTLTSPNESFYTYYIESAMKLVESSSRAILVI